MSAFCGGLFDGVGVIMSSRANMPRSTALPARPTVFGTRFIALKIGFAKGAIVSAASPNPIAASPAFFAMYMRSPY